MKKMEQIETRLAELFAKVPSLPKNAQAWIGENAWWIILVFAILNAFGVVRNLQTLSGIATRNSLGNIYISGGSDLFTGLAVLNLIVSAVVTLLYFLAVRPLRARQKRGWNYVLYGMLTAVAYLVVSAVLTGLAFASLIGVISVGIGLVFRLLFAAVWLYFLFQVRGEFTGRVANASEATVVGIKAPVRKPVASSSKNPTKKPAPRKK